jgi:beta-lactam-binding protein with PASTA domain
VSSADADPLLGRLVDERYHVDEQIARGGMATVYRATDTRLDRTIALKVMHPSFAEDPAFVDRFTREARAAARLSNPHIVKVFDQGQEDHVVYLAMEYVPGRTLRDVLNERGRLGVDEAVTIIDPVLQALAAAHADSVVHRDVKPENVLISSKGHVYVTDFGLARAVNNGATQHATAGLLLGTVAYLSPEQVSPGVSDERSDVYAVGVMLFEMLTGSPPFSGSDAMAVAYRHVNEDVPAPSTAEGVSPALDDIVERATSRDPARRPVDAAAMLRLLRLVPQSPATIDLHETMVVPVAVGAAVRHDTAVAPAAAVQTVPPPSSTTDETFPAPAGSPGDSGVPQELDPAAYRKRRRRRGIIALVLVALLAIGVGVLAWWLGSGRYETVPQVAGLTASQAESRLQDQGFDVKYASKRYSETVTAGDVISSDPKAGTDADSGATVTLVVSKGKELYDVPTLKGKDLSAAKKLLKEHLAVGQVERRYSNTVAVGIVMQSQPDAGQALGPGTEVDLVVSKGPPPVPVPNLVGSSLDDARATLDDLDLRLTQADQKYSENYDEGIIMSQDPGEGAQLQRGSTISVVVSLGPPLVTVPDVVDMPIDEAEAKLKAAGLKWEVYEPFGISPLNRVASQDPEGGTQAPRGSTVRLGII